MSILLCAATSFEIQPTLDLLQQKGWQARVEVLITGVGLLAATYALTKSVTLVKPGLLLQAGIAGSFDKNLSLTQVVAVKDEVVGDLGVMEGGSFKSLFDMGFQSANEHPWREGVLRNPHPSLLEKTGLPQVKSVTINEISTAPARIAYYKNELGVSVESMEGAALHYVALQEDIPFLQLRAISNHVGERDKGKWNLQGSIASLNQHLQAFFIKTLDT
ncbi:MAG: hypothetical protein JWP88_1624 [Flaviaesturariibacter sp.]|nr:hypothetical protein [Flaviaesturariibacter sp.]